MVNYYCNDITVAEFKPLNIAIEDTTKDVIWTWYKYDTC